MGHDERPRCPTCGVVSTMAVCPRYLDADMVYCVACWHPPWCHERVQRCDEGGGSKCLVPKLKS